MEENIIKNRLFAIIMIGALTMQMVACAGTATEEVKTPVMEPVSETTQEPNAQIANPWRDITEDEAFGMIPNCFKTPEGATNIRWSAMGEADAEGTLPGPMVQLDFDLDGFDIQAIAEQSYDPR